MDTFIEKIVSKKKDILDYVIISGTSVLAVFIILMIFTSMGAAGGAIAIVLSVAIGYLTYMIITARNIEYEYALTNGELDIDKIIARRKRKRMFSGNCREFEIMARASSEKNSEYSQGVMAKINAASSLKSEDVYFFVAQYKGKRVMVYFEPDDRIFSLIKAMNRKVIE